LPLLAVPETTLNCRRQVVASDQLAVAQAIVAPMPWPVDSFNLGLAWLLSRWIWPAQQASQDSSAKSDVMMSATLLGRAIALVVKQSWLRTTGSE
jgi:hypothetical protein